MFSELNIKCFVVSASKNNTWKLRVVEKFVTRQFRDDPQLLNCVKTFHIKLIKLCYHYENHCFAPFKVYWNSCSALFQFSQLGRFLILWYRTLIPNRLIHTHCTRFDINQRKRRANPFGNHVLIAKVKFLTIRELTLNVLWRLHARDPLLYYMKGVCSKVTTFTFTEKIFVSLFVQLQNLRLQKWTRDNIW